MSRIHGPRDIRTDIFIEVATFSFTLSLISLFLSRLLSCRNTQKKKSGVLLFPSCFKMTFSNEKTSHVFLIQIFRFKELFLYSTVRVALAPSQIGFLSRSAQIINKADIVMHIQLPLLDILRI